MRIIFLAWATIQEKAKKKFDNPGVKTRLFLESVKKRFTFHPAQDKVTAGPVLNLQHRVQRGGEHRWILISYRGMG
jgi:hypothetical protein